MTRHYLTPKDRKIADTVIVGYDRPLNTFFVQVYNDAANDFLVWEGFGPLEIPYAYNAIALVAEHAHIPAKLADALEHDRLCAPYRSMQESNATTYWSKRAPKAPGGWRPRLSRWTFGLIKPEPAN